MNPTVVERLTPYCDDPPDDLVSHFSSESLPHEPALFINLLNLEDALEYTDAIQDTFLGEPLGLVVLDDANNSNPFCFVTRGPARGLVLHLSHDDESRFAFSSLSRFLEAISRAIEREESIDKLQFDAVYPAVNQADLKAYLQTQCEQDGIVEEICILLSLLREPPMDLINLLAEHDDFYVRESLAEFIKTNPATRFLPVATTLENDRHPQVSRPGKQALQAICQLVESEK